MPLFVDGSLIDQSLYLGIALLVIASFAAGYIDAIAGGAGLILVPAFLLTGLPPQVTLAQEKLVSTVGTLAAINNFSRSKSIVWKVVPFGVIFGIVGAYVGARAVLFLPSDVISYFVIGLLPLGLMATFYKSRLNERTSAEINYSPILVSIVSLTVGFYDGFFGPGTGSIFIIVLYLVNNFTLLKSSATSKIFNFSSNIGAFVAFFLAGKMLILIGIPMILASLLGNHFGSHMAIKTDGQAIKTALFLTVGIMIGGMIYKVIS